MRHFETDAQQKGFNFIAGIDEAGRGPLAGPVVSAAVILPNDFSHPLINDSKKLSEKARESLFTLIHDNALSVAVGISSSREIDDINILQASLLSMKRAVQNLDRVPDYLLIDGKFTLEMDIRQSAIIKGDSKSISIAAASIIAKVSRDRIMARLHDRFPGYGFLRHKGYPTRAHKQAIIDLGPCPFHRKTFRGVKEVIHGQ